MKKILTVLLAIVCLCCSFFTGCNSGAKYEEIKVEGEQLDFDAMRDWVAIRQNSYLESDLKKSNGHHWYDIDINLEQTTSSSHLKVERTLSMQGKMGVNIDDENKLHLYYDVEIQVEMKRFALKDSSEKPSFIGEANIKLIVVDNVAYADTTAKETSKGREYIEKIKRQGSIDSVLGNDLDLDDLFKVEGQYVKAYGVNAVSVIVENQYANFYKKGNTFFIIEKDSSGLLQYKLTFEKNSAIVKEEKVYIKQEYATGYNMEIVNILMYSTAKRIKEVRIKKPSDSDEYKKRF